LDEKTNLNYLLYVYLNGKDWTFFRIDQDLIIKVECNYCDSPFRNQGDLTRHINSVHKEFMSFQCDYPKCGRSQNPFKRKDHYRGHLRDYHKEVIGGAEDGERHIQRWRCEKCLGRRGSQSQDCSSCGKAAKAQRGQAIALAPLKRKR